MRRSRLQQLRLSLIELWYVVFATSVVDLLGNGKFILERAGLISSAHLIGQTVSAKVLWGTNFLDTFRFTANAVNLIVWGVTGLIIYSLLQALVQGLRAIQYRRDFDSARYVHPYDFSRRTYWRRVLANAVLGFSLLVLLIMGTLLYIGTVVPGSFTWMRRFILTPDWHTLPDLLLGLGISLAGTSVQYVLLKSVIHWHRTAALKA